MHQIFKSVPEAYGGLTSSDALITVMSCPPFRFPRLPDKGLERSCRGAAARRNETRTKTEKREGESGTDMKERRRERQIRKYRKEKRGNRRGRELTKQKR